MCVSRNVVGFERFGDGRDFSILSFYGDDARCDLLVRDGFFESLQVGQSKLVGGGGEADGANRGSFTQGRKGLALAHHSEGREAKRAKLENHPCYFRSC